jgi:hypothetical protein
MGLGNLLANIALRNLYFISSTFAIANKLVKLKRKSKRIEMSGTVDDTNSDHPTMDVKPIAIQMPHQKHLPENLGRGTTDTQNHSSLME